MKTTNEKESLSECRALLEELLAESIQREKESVKRERLIQRRIFGALGRVKVMEPIRELHSPTGIKSKWAEIVKAQSRSSKKQGGQPRR
jgi:hypothetical protein